MVPKGTMKDTVGICLALAGRLACVGLLVFGALGAEMPAAPPTSAAAPGPKLPPAKEIIARYVQGIGGKEAILKHTAMRGKGTFEVSGQGQKATGELEVLGAKPNKQVARINIRDMGQIVAGFDGKTGWLIVPGAGPMLLRGRMLDQARDDAIFYNQLHEETNYQSMETVALTQFEGQECYQLKLVFKSGREVTEFYDVKTGLLAGFKAMQETLQASLEVTSRLSDYKKFGDWLQPTKLTQKMAAIEQTITIASITYDPIPDSEFEPPAEVKALLKEQPAK